MENAYMYAALTLNPIALRNAKIIYNFECNMLAILYWMNFSAIHIRGVHFQFKGCLVMFIKIFLFENGWNNLQSSGDAHQMPLVVASDLGLHFFPDPFRGFQYKLG